MEYYFGLHKGHLSEKANKIANKHKASHINYIEPSGEKRGWFACGNLGEPYNSVIAKAVMADIEKIGGIVALQSKR
ncbi:MAG: hypothetical protein M0R00_04145 [Candidatus Omnitrophica bacterium]|jgi:hypothetical protein|nr:hypothetical protein [Candidatus Omnitrophota bacterium]